MTNQGGAEELIEVTSIVADVPLGVRERKYAYKSRGRATAIVELTVCAERADDCSPIEHVVRYRYSDGRTWRQPQRNRRKLESHAEALDLADSTWRNLMSWLRAITPIAPLRRTGAGADCSCHE